MDFATALAACNEAGIDFVKTELRLAHGFLDVAKNTKISENRRRSHEDVRKAYRSIMTFLPRLHLSLDQSLAFDQLIVALEERMMLADINF